MRSWGKSMKRYIQRIRYGVIAAIFLAAVGVSNLGVFTPTAQAFAGGDGSEEAPYQVASCSQLQDVYSFEGYNNLYNKHYVLTADIDCSEVENFDPLYGNAEYVFSGTFDGQGHTIRNVTVNNPDYQGGIFGYAVNAIFKNLNLETIQINTENDEAGSLVGNAANTIISDVYATDVSVFGEGSVGGLIGVFETYGESALGGISRASAAGYAIGDGAHVGGLIGRVIANPQTILYIEQVYADIVASGVGAHVGGLIGSVTSTGGEGVDGGEVHIEDAYVWGAVQAPDADNVGGLIGTISAVQEFASSITIRNTYAFGNGYSLGGKATVGGLIGLVRSPDAETSTYTIEHSFAVVSVLGDSGLGGLIGVNNAGSQLVSIGNYYDTDASEQTVCDSGETLLDDENNACVQVDTNGLYFYNTNAVPPMVEWDFDSDEGIWKTQESTPPVFRNFGIQASPAVTLTTLAADAVTQSSARLHASAQLNNGLTTAEDWGEDGVIPGFLINTSSTVDWDNYVRDGSASHGMGYGTPDEDDDTRFTYYVDFDELECGTQYWYVAVYGYNNMAEIGLADNVETFTTDACEEDTTPNEGDANDDGTPDDEQSHVVSFINQNTSKYVAIELGEDCEISTVLVSREDQLTVKDAAYEYDNNLIGFNAECGTAGYEMTVKIFFYDVAKANLVLRKHNYHTGTSFTLTAEHNASLEQVTIDGHTVTIASYHIVDGGPLDMDGERDGNIADPIGLGRQVVGVPNTGLIRR